MDESKRRAAEKVPLVAEQEQRASAGLKRSSDIIPQRRARNRTGSRSATAAAQVSRFFLMLGHETASWKWTGGGVCSYSAAGYL